MQDGQWDALSSLRDCCLQGVIVYFRVVDGQLRAGDVVKLMNTGKEYQVDEVGVLAPKQVPVRGVHSCSCRAERVLLGVCPAVL